MVAAHSLDCLSPPTAAMFSILSDAYRSDIMLVENFHYDPSHSLSRLSITYQLNSASSQDCASSHIGVGSK